MGTEVPSVAGKHDALIRNALIQIPNGSIFIFDTDLRFVFAGGQGLANAGLQNNELIGHSLAEVLPPEQATLIESHLRQALEGEEVCFDLEINEQWYTVNVAPSRNQQGEIEALVVMALNCDERKRTELALEESHHDLQTMRDSITNGYFAVDSQWHITDINTRGEKMLKRTRAELIGKSLWAEFADAVGTVFYDQYHAAVTEQKAVSFEAYYQPLDLWVAVRAMPTPTGLSVHFHRINQRKEAEAALRKERDFSSAILDTVGSLVIVLDTEGRVVGFNRACEQLTGYSFEEVKEQELTGLLLPRDEAEAVRETFKSISAGHFPIHYESYWVTRDGERRLIAWSNTALLCEAGEVSHVIGTGIDITGRHRVEESLRQAHDELQRTHNQLEQRVAERTAELDEINKELYAQVAERQMAMGALHEVVGKLEQARTEAEAANNAKSDFLSRMSHELRTPMNAILGFGQILEMRELAPRESDGVQQILKAGRHLLQLINEVLEISRIEAGRLSLSMEPIEVMPLLQEVLGLLQPLAAQRNIVLINQAAFETSSPGGHHVLADRQRLQQVMLNLLSNAIKYNRNGGTVTISLQRVSGGELLRRKMLPQLDIEAEPEAFACLRIAVRDTGPGIAPADHEKIFLPFERLGADFSKTEGTGIGLALAKSLIELMNGHIAVESQVDNGSTFWIELPIVENPVDRMQRLTERAGGSTQSLLSVDRPVTILYIEDNASNINVMEALLESMPQVRLLTAIQGRIGIELARQHRPDVVLLDLHLPDVQGDEVLRQLQGDDSSSDIPVVIISADATSNQINRLLAAGARHYLTKPLNIKHLVAVLEQLLQPSSAREEA